MALSVWTVAELGAFYTEHRSELLAHANRVLKDSAKAEEITQDSLIKFMLAAPELESEEHAIEMLLELSDKVHTVITGVTVGIISGDKAEFHSITVDSQVEFSNLSRLECEKYCASKEPFDKAGAYGIQGYGSAFVKEIKGSYSNIVGLPIHEVAELFKKLNIPFWLN